MTMNAEEREHVEAALFNLRCAALELEDLLSDPKPDPPPTPSKDENAA